MAESFEKRIFETINQGALLPCIAVGYRLGLYEKMAEFTEPKTSQQIADSMDFKERSVFHVTLFFFLLEFNMN